MDTPPHPSKRKRNKLLVALALAVVISLALYLLLAPSNPKIVWLTPEELAKSSQPGKLTVLRRKLMALTAPLWRWYHPHRAPVHINSLIFIAPSSIVESQLSLTMSISTNKGARAWIVSSAGFDSLTNQFSNFWPSSATKVEGSSVSLGHPYLSPWTILVSPTISGGTVNLGIDSRVPSRPATMENFAILVTLSTSTAVLIDCGKENDSVQSHLWLVISPTILDANGNPIKP